MRASDLAAPEAEPDDLFEMANLYPRTTGLPMTVWVSPRGGARHDAGIKVSRSGGDRMVPADTAVVGIRSAPALIEGDLTPRDFAAVARWIELNRAALLEFWDGTIDTIELGQRLIRA